MTTEGEGEQRGPVGRALEKIGSFAATVGKTGPKKRPVRILVEGGLALAIFGFLVFTVVSQWSEIREQGVEFSLLWLVPALVVIVAYYTMAAWLWGVILARLGNPVTFGEAQRIWALPLLVRYIPGSVLFVLARILLAERVGVPRRVATAGIVYEQALSIAAALTISTWFLIAHPDLSDYWTRWLPLLIVPLLLTILHPKVFGPLSNRLLAALGREPLPETIGFRSVLALFGLFLALWSVMGVGVFFAARSAYVLGIGDLMVVTASQTIGFLAAVASAVVPAGLGVRDAAFAWAVKVAIPSGSFGVGAAIAIAVRAAQTVAELIYVGSVSLVERRRRRGEAGSPKPEGEPAA